MKDLCFLISQTVLVHVRAAVALALSVRVVLRSTLGIRGVLRASVEAALSRLSILVLIVLVEPLKWKENFCIQLFQKPIYYVYLNLINVFSSAQHFFFFCWSVLLFLFLQRTCYKI